MPENEEDVPEGFGIAVPLHHITQEMNRRHDRAHMAKDEFVASVNRLLDTLDIESLVTLRRMLNMETEATWNQFFDGQIFQVLRAVHKVDPDTGEPLEMGVPDEKPIAPTQE